MNLTEQLRRDEDEKLYAYQDHLGYWTIGVGILIDRRKGGGITSEESAYLLANRIRSKEAELRASFSWFPLLDEARQAALLNMAFQMGVDGLKGFKNMLAAVASKRWEEVEMHALDSDWAKQTPERARRVAKQLATGGWQ